MILALDTNRYCDFCANSAEAVALCQLADKIVIPFPVLAELRAGFACGSLSRRNEGVLNTFLNRPRVSICFANDQTTFHYARIYRQLREQGTPIPVNDLWIAALVQQHNFSLYTRDKHFDHLPQLVRVN